MISRPIEVLLVEDEPADIRLTMETMKESKVVNVIHTVVSGEQALDFLYKNICSSDCFVCVARGSFINVPKPDLIILDLNLPGLDGRDLLKMIKQDENLKTIPVVIFSTSKAEVDILKSYQCGANCYVSKPLTLDRFEAIVRTIENFWFSIVILPPK